MSSSKSAIGSSKFVWGELKTVETAQQCAGVVRHLWYSRTACDIQIVCYGVPESELSLAHPGEPCGEDVSVSGEDGSHRPDPLMWSQTFLLVSGGTRASSLDSSNINVWELRKCCQNSFYSDAYGIFISIFYTLTATTSLLRGSHTRRRRSLQVVQNKLPFRFQLML